MRFVASLGILVAATTAFAESGPVKQLQACLEQPVETFEMPVGVSEDQRTLIVESIRAELDNVCIQSATQSCFQSDNSDRCFGALNLYVEEEYVRVFEARAPQNLDLSSDETVTALVAILKDYRTTEMAPDSGYSCNYSKSMCDFIFSSMLLGDLRSAARNLEQSN